MLWEIRRNEIKEPNEGINEKPKKIKRNLITEPKKDDNLYKYYEKNRDEIKDKVEKLVQNESVELNKGKSMPDKKKMKTRKN